MTHSPKQVVQHADDGEMGESITCNQNTPYIFITQTRSLILSGSFDQVVLSKESGELARTARRISSADINGDTGQERLSVFRWHE